MYSNLCLSFHETVPLKKEPFFAVRINYIHAMLLLWASFWGGSGAGEGRPGSAGHTPPHCSPWSSPPARGSPASRTPAQSQLNEHKHSNSELIFIKAYR